MCILNMFQKYTGEYAFYLENPSGIKYLKISFTISALSPKSKRLSSYLKKFPLYPGDNIQRNIYISLQFFESQLESLKRAFILILEV